MGKWTEGEKKKFPTNQIMNEPSRSALIATSLSLPPSISALNSLKIARSSWLAALLEMSKIASMLLMMGTGTVDGLATGIGVELTMGFSVVGED